MATQTLTFVKVGEEYVAAFETTAKFALHLERPEAGSLTFGVSSVKDGDFARVENLPSRVRYQTVFDHDFSAEVYPKYIRVASETEPTMAVVTSEGEITPIEVVPDSLDFKFNVEMTDNGEVASGTDEGNYTGTYNTIAAFAKGNGTVEDYGYSVKDEETIAKADIKVNNYKVNEVEYHETEEFIKMQTDALSSNEADGAAVLRRDKVSFAYALPVEEPEQPEDGGVLTYAFDVPVNNVGGYYVGSLEGDFAKLKNDLLQIMKAEGWDDDYDTLDGSLLEGKVNITFNGYSPLYYEYYDNKIVMGTDLNNWLVGGDLQSHLTDTSLYIEIPQPWNPDAPKGDVIEYHFEIPMSEESVALGYEEGVINGDYEELYNKLHGVLKQYGTLDGNNYKIEDSELLNRYVNITFNGVQAYDMRTDYNDISTSNDDMIVLNGGDANITKTFVWFQKESW